MMSTKFCDAKDVSLQNQSQTHRRLLTRLEKIVEDYEADKSIRDAWIIMVELMKQVTKLTMMKSSDTLLEKMNCDPRNDSLRYFKFSNRKAYVYKQFKNDEEKDMTPFQGFNEVRDEIVKYFGSAESYDQFASFVGRNMLMHGVSRSYLEKDAFNNLFDRAISFAKNEEKDAFRKGKLLRKLVVKLGGEAALRQSGLFTLPALRRQEA